MGNKPSQKVLVVDDEEPILELLRYNLEKQGYDVKIASDGFIGVELAKRFHPDLVLLDIMMPKMDGVETCRQLRAIPELQNTFIVFLTARSEEYSEVAAFDVGADDYITKPIKPRALMSRISALFRRDSKKKSTSAQITLGNLVIARNSYTIKVISRDDVLQNIWGSDVYVLAITVDVHIRKVREKVGDDYITTVKGVGYKFNLR